MTTADDNSISCSSRNVSVTLKLLVKLRSFKTQRADRIILQLEDICSLEQCSGNKSHIDSISNHEDKLNHDVNNIYYNQEPPSKDTSGRAIDLREAELNNLLEETCTVYKDRDLHSGEISNFSGGNVFYARNKSSTSKDCYPRLESTQTISPLRAFYWKNQSVTSRQHFVVNNSNVNNNSQAFNSDTQQLRVRSRDSHMIKSGESDKEVLNNSSLIRTKQITPAIPSQTVTEACMAITNNCLSSATKPETRNKVQECNHSSNNVEEYVGTNTQFKSEQMRDKNNSDWMQSADESDRINAGLQMLNSELEAMRATDLALLKQLIAISQAIQRVQAADLMRSTRSMSVIGSPRNPQLRKSIERQLSVPQTPSCRRDSFNSYRRASAENGFGDSMCSLDEEDYGLQNQLEESNSSLNSFYNATRSITSPSQLHHDLILSYDLAEKSEQEYEDILQRNVRLWKIGSQRQDLPEEMVVV